MGAPVHTLLGEAFRDSIPAYVTGCYYRGDDVLNYETALPALADEARSHAAADFGMLKIKIGLLSVEADLARGAAIRSAIGQQVGLLVDANHDYNAYTAIRIGHGLEKRGVLVFKEPVPPEDRDGYRQVRAALDLAVAGGECW